MIPTYYRSSHPEVVAYHARFVEMEAAFIAQALAFAERFPGFKPVQSEGYGWASLLGLRGATNRDCPGEHWRADRRYGWSVVWVPARSRKPGKDLAAELAAIRFNAGFPPGLPVIILVNGRYGGSFEPIGSEFWSGWDCSAAHIEASDKFSPDLWTRSLPSEYWAAREAGEESAPLTLALETDAP